MFDTHCHLNFSAFKNNLDQIIQSAHESGVKNILVPGTDVETSIKAVEIANSNEGVYAAVGIHPHHAYEFSVMRSALGVEHEMDDISKLEELLKEKKVVAVGEVGIDRHPYEKTKYKDYKIDNDFIGSQKKLLENQIDLALNYDKSLIIHNREAKEDTLAILGKKWDKKLRGKTVFHCCEPDDHLLEYAKEHGIYIGVDGDITYNTIKQEFIKKVPLEALVLETDSPFLLPEPLRSQKKYPNEPKNIKVIAEFIADVLNIQAEKLVEITAENSRKLFLGSFS